MDVKQILDQINKDLTSAPAERVIYLEGKTDPSIFYGLLGVVPLEGGVHKGTAIRGLKGLKDRGSGKDAVLDCVQIGSDNGFGGRVFGVIDGDGVEFAELARRFDAPFLGPVFTWKAYCIESFFPRFPWNTAWGSEPNWQEELRAYSPYVAVGRVQVLLQSALKTLGLAKRLKPKVGELLATVADLQDAMAKDKHRVAGFDVEVAYLSEVARFEAALATSLVEGLALLDGKWLFSHFMTIRVRQGMQYCIDEWIEHATNTCGGLPEVRDLWERITGAPP